MVDSDFDPDLFRFDYVPGETVQELREEIVVPPVPGAGRMAERAINGAPWLQTVLGAVEIPSSSTRISNGGRAWDDESYVHPLELVGGGPAIASSGFHRAA